ncbi:hypothetical protein HJD18_10175 [Thermoleophilia bacterium SCSIO 60948]|nr:hypothetical protein HJD18_10175 [Thermoleophilia bacterium SCSIO 60948]
MSVPVAIFGIENAGVNTAVSLLLLFLIVVYISLVVYTFLDARRRLEDPVLVTTATVASLFPFVGTIIYSILRPPELLADRRERELEVRASEMRLRQLEEQSCPSCEFPIERNYLRCPNCQTRIKDPCTNCNRPIDPRWSVCPYCETPVRSAPMAGRPASGGRARRPSRPEAEPRREPAAEPARSSRSSSSSRVSPAERIGRSRSSRSAKPAEDSSSAPPAANGGSAPESSEKGAGESGSSRKPAPARSAPAKQRQGSGARPASRRPESRPYDADDGTGR